MKLSTLNKYKGEDVEVIFYDEIEEESFTVTGTLTDVDSEEITVEYEDETGFINIPIDSIRELTITD